MQLLFDYDGIMEGRGCFFMFQSFAKSKKIFLSVLVLLLAVASCGVLAGRSVNTGASVKAAGKDTRSLPVIMYHGLLKDPAYQGKYVISPDELEQDLCYLQKKGYTPVHMQDVFNWQDGKGNLPEKPIVLSFDDGYYNNYVYAYPLAKQYQMKLVIAPIGSCTDRFTGANDDHANYSHVTWPQIQEMMDSGLVEFQNHTYDLHSNRNGRLGAQKLRAESMEEYRRLLWEDVGGLQEKFAEKTGYTPSVFVFPFGAISDGAEEIVWEMGFRGIFTCESHINQISKKEEHLVLGRYLRPHGVSGEKFLSGILESQ